MQFSHIKRTHWTACNFYIPTNGTLFWISYVLLVSFIVENWVYFILKVSLCVKVHSQSWSNKILPCHARLQNWKKEILSYLGPVICWYADMLDANKAIGWQIQITHFIYRYAQSGTLPWLSSFPCVKQGMSFF